MEIDDALVGTSTEDFVVEVEKGEIRRFAQAIGDDNPLYLDEAYARSLGYAAIVAPPTFGAAFRLPRRQPWLEGLDSGRMLAGEQYFTYERPIIAGDVLTCSMQLVRIDEKEGRSGKMQLLVQEVRAVDRNGDMVMTNGRVVVYRAPGTLATSK